MVSAASSTAPRPPRGTAATCALERPHPERQASVILIKSDSFSGTTLVQPLRETPQARPGSRAEAAGWTATVVVAALCHDRRPVGPVAPDRLQALLARRGHHAAPRQPAVPADGARFALVPSPAGLFRGDLVVRGLSAMTRRRCACRRALFGALSCGLAAVAGARLAGLSAGLLAGMLMAAAPIEVQYGQEARSYTLVICLVLVALMGLIAILRAAPGRAPRGAVLAYAGGTLGWIARPGRGAVLVRGRQRAGAVRAARRGSPPLGDPAGGDRGARGPRLHRHDRAGGAHARDVSRAGSTGSRRSPGRICG